MCLEKDSIAPLFKPWYYELEGQHGRMGVWGSDVQGTRERCNLIFKQYQHYC